MKVASTTTERMATEVWSGLRQPQKRLASKYFYDARGSELFDRITQLPEYYLTRTERELLRKLAPVLLGEQGTRTLVELGPGSGEKTRILIDALVRTGPAAAYVPVDISESYLSTIARTLAPAYPALDVLPALSDITRRIRLPKDLPRPLLLAFLGSTIGNFEHSEAVSLLRRSATLLSPGDLFLIGFDLKKDPRVLHTAYNDAEGVTAEFNLNILRVVNREVGCNFDLDAFAHRAFYDEANGRIEMHLVSLRAQRVRIGSLGHVHFTEGETIHTEISCKYDQEEVRAMLTDAGLRLVRWDQDSERRFALATAERFCP